MVTVGQYLLGILPGFCNVTAKLRKTTSKHNSYSQTQILAREEKQSRQKDRRHINYFEAASSGPEQTHHSDSQRGKEEHALKALETHR